jgi:hypothetical protein
MAYVAPPLKASNDSQEPQLVECWQIDLDEGEYKWSREDGTMPGCLDIWELLVSQNDGMKEVVMAARSAECACHLLFAITEAHSVPQFTRRDVGLTAAELVAEALTYRLDGDVAGHPASVFLDDGYSLVLRLDDIDIAAGDASAQADLMQDLFDTIAEELEMKLSEATGLTAPRNLQKHNRESTKGRNEFVSWMDLGAAVVDINDGLCAEERHQGAHQIAEMARSQSHLEASEEEDGKISLVIPLGRTGPSAANHIINAMYTAALAALCETLIGGRDIEHRAIRSIDVRGHRGCAVKFVLESPCTMS